MLHFFGDRTQFQLLSAAVSGRILLHATPERANRVADAVGVLFILFFSKRLPVHTRIARKSEKRRLPPISLMTGRKTVRKISPVMRE